MSFLLCDPGWCVHKSDVQNKWDDNTHTHTHTRSGRRIFDITPLMLSVSPIYVHWTNSGCGKRAAHKNGSIGFPELTEPLLELR